MVDVSTVDTSVDLLGMKLDAPIVIAPSGGKNLVIPNAETVVARAAAASKTLICTATGVEKLLDEAQPVKWWSNTIGHPTKSAASSYARRV
jgi:isopentenyl diphosphate isomerase/L-lactate dehydrogenase-like FMN-dependent dehydrogenase